MVLKTTSAEETKNLAKQLGENCAVNVICLYGDLGAGKTTFVRGLAKSLGVKGRIQSPTFTYQRIHRGIKTLFHFDCYRMDGEDSLMLHEIEEALKQKNAVVVIEWSEKIAEFLPKKRLDIRIEHIAENIRQFHITSHD